MDNSRGETREKIVTREARAETGPHANARLEAFCDGVFAIALTLLIIDVKIHSPESITSVADFWAALRHLGPIGFAFLLSFAIILISWVNHHAIMKLVNHSSATFIYANGFLLLTIVTIPFSASLLGEFLWTDFAAPAVVIYNAVLTLLAVGWILMTGVALKSRFTIDAEATLAMSKANRNGYFAVALYGLLSITALWFPLAVAIITTVTWIFWLALGIRMKHA